MRKYGWFSQKAFVNGVDTFVYLTSNNEEVEITCVSPTLKNPYSETSIYHNDAICKGEIVKFLKVKKTTSL